MNFQGSVRIWLLFFLALCIGFYKGIEWFQSPAYVEFLMKNKEKPWSSRAVLWTAQFYVFSENWHQAMQFADICLKEEKWQKREQPPLRPERPERADCLFLLAKTLDGMDRMRDALAVYDEFKARYPDHPKNSLAHRRAEVLRNTL